jgi:outer membrane protein assembly factor BamB
MRTSLLRLLLALAILSTALHAQEWPSFRGPSGSGVAADARPPLTWNTTTSANVAWRTAVPGLGHSSPIVWGDRIFMTTAVSDAAASQSVTLGDSEVAGIDPANDIVPHRWQVMAFDRASGKLLWTRVAHQGVPRVKRHVKASHASATPATAGKVLIAMLG